MRKIFSWIWRWLTLADISAEDFSVKSVPREGTCNFCGNHATCTVWINDESWRTCLLHMRSPQEMLRGDL